MNVYQCQSEELHEEAAIYRVAALVAADAPGKAKSMFVKFVREIGEPRYEWRNKTSVKLAVRNAEECEPPVVAGVLDPLHPLCIGYWAGYDNARNAQRARADERA